MRSATALLKKAGVCRKFAVPSVISRSNPRRSTRKSPTRWLAVRLPLLSPVTDGEATSQTLRLVSNTIRRGRKVDDLSQNAWPHKVSAKNQVLDRFNFF